MKPTSHGLAVAANEPGADLLVVPIDLYLDLTVAQLMLRPAAPGQNFEISADFDEQHYEFEVTKEESGASMEADRLRYDVRFRPLSRSLSFLRMKLGENPPLMTVLVPEDQPIRIFGQLLGSFAAVEAGGLTLDALAMEVNGGAATVSFLKPLAKPMESFSLTGNKGSLEVTGLGNGSPRTATLDQRYGELDIDLRRSWVRDASIDVHVFLAGGSCWLPRDVDVHGLADQGISDSIDFGSKEEGGQRAGLEVSVEQRGG